MTEVEARKIYEEYCDKQQRRPTASDARSHPDGYWLFVEKAEAGPQGAYEGVVVRASGEAFPFGGAIGKVFRGYPCLGAPRSTERLLGATTYGRYQSFDGGVAIWEGPENIGFPVVESLSSLRRQLCIVAFFDLRGFSLWSKSADPDQVQKAIVAFEDAVHVGFPTAPTSLPKLFLKGTGDGVMIVSQADWYGNATPDQRMTELMPRHALHFLQACECTISSGRACLSQNGLPLAIGCGIASGELDRVFLFGRIDFIGCAANAAAKLQQHAWNEICVTPDFGALLNKDGRDLNADWELAANGWRLRSQE